MTEQRNNISWERVALQEIKARHMLEQKVEHIRAELKQAKRLISRTVQYKSHLEESNTELEQAYENKTDDYQRALDLLHKAKSIIEQRQSELEIITEENVKLSTALEQKIAFLNQETTAHNSTQEKLNLALRQLELTQKINALPASPDLVVSNQPAINQPELEEFFVYKPFGSLV